MSSLFGSAGLKTPRCCAGDCQIFLIDAAELRSKRTLTNLYNERPTWLDLAHRKLDEAVFATYGWESDLSDDEILTRLLALNQQRAAD